MCFVEKASLERNYEGITRDEFILRIIDAVKGGFCESVNSHTSVSRRHACTDEHNTEG